MCHPEVPLGTVPPPVRTEEVDIRLQTVERMPGLLAMPDRTPAPAVLIANDVMGRSPFYEHLARRLAQAGYIALDPEFFFREGPVADREAAQARRLRLDQPRTLRDLESAAGWLRKRADVGGGIASIGFCMGGTLVLDLAATGAIDATVCFYGFPARGGDSPKAPPAPLEIASQIQGRVLGFWGDQDTIVGMDNVKALDDRLTEAQITHEFHIYPGLGHGFLRAFLDAESSPGHEQACEAWVRTLDFLKETIRN
jgi:carboxymethylenebutenolidase